MRTVIDPATPDLLDRWMRGDGEAAEEIYHRYVERVERYAMKWTKDSILAEEVAAETMAQGLAKTREGKRPDRFTYWLLGIARNLAVMRHRLECRETGLPEGVLSSPNPSPRTLSIRGELADLLRDAIDHLPPSCREVVNLHAKENLDRKEIAERLGVDPEAIDRRFARAYDLMRGEIRKHVTSMVSEPVGERSITWNRISALRPSFRQVVTIHHLESRTKEETAKRLRLPLETVEARLGAAYEQMSCAADADFSLAREEYLRSL